jgi:hypothetical protein
MALVFLKSDDGKPVSEKEVDRVLEILGLPHHHFHMSGKLNEFLYWAEVENIKNWPEKKPVKGVLLANERYFYVATISADLVAGRY